MEAGSSLSVTAWDALPSLLPASPDLAVHLPKSPATCSPPSPPPLHIEATAPPRTPTTHCRPWVVITGSAGLTWAQVTCGTRTPRGTSRGSCSGHLRGPGMWSTPGERPIALPERMNGQQRGGPRDMGAFYPQNYSKKGEDMGDGRSHILLQTGVDQYPLLRASLSWDSEKAGLRLSCLY